jgi:hypothetical protein
VCGDCVVPLALVAWLLASRLGERGLVSRFGACLGVALMVWQVRSADKCGQVTLCEGEFLAG